MCKEYRKQEDGNHNLCEEWQEALIKTLEHYHKRSSAPHWYSVDFKLPPEIESIIALYGGIIDYTEEGAP